MRYLITTLATLSLGALPIAAQNPTPPTPPTPPAQQGGPPMPLTPEQRQQQQAIREKYTRELEAQRAAIQATNEKMRAEIEGVLTPEQRARMAPGGGQGAMRRGFDGATMMPPANDIYARPGGMMRRRAEAMMGGRRGRITREIIIVRPRLAMRMRGMGGRGGAMGRGAVRQAPPPPRMNRPPAPGGAARQAPATPPRAARVAPPVKPPVKPGGGGGA